ncbi:MAG TPA: hypothetical protein VE218_01790 [Acidobacteriaceae bacterium]|nr:hypothetical protein [Acidobacteriaceae bacterium]
MTRQTLRAAILSNLLFSLPVAAGLLGSATAASAQTSLNVNVPFAFSANNHYLPAGEYHVQRVSDCFLSIRNIKTGSALVVIIRPETGNALDSYSRLVFDREGNQNYLTQVWTPDTNKYSQLTVRPKFNQELAKDVPAGSTIEVAAK